MVEAAAIEFEVEPTAKSSFSNLIFLNVPGNIPVYKRPLQGIHTQFL